MCAEGYCGIMQGLSYEYDVSKLWLGGSYGNIEIFTRTDARSNLAGLWCAEDDQFYVGRLVMHFAVEGERLEARRKLQPGQLPQPFAGGVRQGAVLKGLRDRGRASCRP